ncbi:hypothetical protein CR513_06869, partial [Mucuna pruriens]
MSVLLTRHKCIKAFVWGTSCTIFISYCGWRVTWADGKGSSVFKPAIMMVEWPKNVLKIMIGIQRNVLSSSSDSSRNFRFKDGSPLIFRRKSDKRIEIRHKPHEELDQDKMF